MGDLTREIDALIGNEAFTKASTKQLLALRAGDIAGVHATELADADASLDEVVALACEAEDSPRDLVVMDEFVLGATISAFHARKGSKDE